MSTPREISFRFGRVQRPRRLNLVQDRPTLGTLARTRRRFAWVLPAVDLACAVLALLAVVLANSADAFPAVLIAPALVIGFHSGLGLYSERASRARFEDGLSVSRLAGRALAAAALAWSVSLLTELSSSAQLLLFVAFLALDAGARAIFAPLLLRLDRPERWVLIGDEETSARLKAYEPLRQFATIVHTFAHEPITAAADRTEALHMVHGCNADRIVISSRHADDEGLLGLVRVYRSLGVAVSMLPRPLDLLEAPGGMTPRRIGGLPLFEVKSLSRGGGTRYRGEDRRRDRKTKISVVVPALNEEHNIGDVLRRLPGGLHEVILVDGNSHDRTIEVAMQAAPGIKVVLQHGHGKGAALRSGFAAVTGNLVVMLDADCSADPAEIPRFVEALENGADFAKGSRFVGDGGSDDITRVRSAGNRVLSGTANLLHQTRFTDLCYGYNAFWTRCLPFISLDAPGFEVETLINLRIAAAGMRITEVPSYEASRLSGQSNLKTFSDGWRVLKTILRESSLDPRSGRLRRPAEVDVAALASIEGFETFDERPSDRPATEGVF